MTPIKSRTVLIKHLIVKFHIISFVICIPLLVVSSTVTWAINDIGLYQKGFDKYHISLKTGISSEDLTNVGGEIQKYFNSLEEPLSVTTEIFGEERILFNNREVTHMRDVKKLIHLVYSVMIISGAYVICMITWSCISGPIFRFYIRPTIIIYGCGLTILSVVSLGILSLMGFDEIFVIFHKMSFGNDLWILDPRTDYLIMLFPLGFWFDITMKIAIISVITSLAITAASFCAQIIASAKNKGRKSSK